MWNRWDSPECDIIFRAKGPKLWRKWLSLLDRHGNDGAPAPFYAYLTKEGRKRIVERAMACYNS